MLHNHMCDVKRTKIRAKILIQEISFTYISRYICFISSKYYFIWYLYFVNCKHTKIAIFSFISKKIIEYIKILKSSLQFWAFIQKRQYIKKRHYLLIKNVI